MGFSESSDHFYPNEVNLGCNCTFWDLGSMACVFPKAELQGRHSCEGIIDDVCLYRKNGRTPASLSSEQILEIKTRGQDLYDKSYLPPGDTIP
jgi:hypothetical protein